MCLLLGDVMIKMADFEVDICLLAETFVKDQGLDKAITKFLKYLTKQALRDRNANFIRNKDVLILLLMGFREQFLFQFIPGLRIELHNLDFSCLKFFDMLVAILTKKAWPDRQIVVLKSDKVFFSIFQYKAVK